MRSTETTSLLRAASPHPKTSPDCRPQTPSKRGARYQENSSVCWSQADHRSKLRLRAGQVLRNADVDEVPVRLEAEKAAVELSWKHFSLKRYAAVLDHPIHDRWLEQVHATIDKTRLSLRALFGERRDP